jgi:antirestriction protein
MDSRFLELWGHFLIQAAKNQQFLEQFVPSSSESQQTDWDFSKWVKYCYENLPSFQYLFQKSAGLDHMTELSKQSLQTWREGVNAFYEQWKEFASLFGLVPQEEYEKLAKEHEQLKQRAEEQEKTIERLQKLLEQKGIFDVEEVSNEFNKLLQEQNEQFKKLMNAFDQSWKAGSRSGNRGSE